MEGIFIFRLRTFSRLMSPIQTSVQILEKGKRCTVRINGRNLILKVG